MKSYLADHLVVRITHLSKATESLTALEPYLDDRDRGRAARFRFPADRSRFILGRALIRKSLGHYLEIAPVKVELAYTDLGRPFFPQDEKIQFSISHTQDLVGVALTSGARVGIDLESIKQTPDLFDLAERIFSNDDLGKFQAFPSAEKLPAFYRAWTRKEAYLKARGEGIAEGLQQISVSLGPEETLTIEDSRTHLAENWHLLSLPVPPSYAGALACDDSRRPLDGAYVRFEQGELVTDAPL